MISRNKMFHYGLFGAVLLILLILSTSCTKDTGSTLSGTILFEGKPLPGAQIELYLKEGDRERSAQPFAVATTGDSGTYSIGLPAGRYVVVARKKIYIDNTPHMLMGEASESPVELDGGATGLSPLVMEDMGGKSELSAVAGTGISGSILAEGGSPKGSYIYVYTSETSDLHGPSYGKAIRVGDDGAFQVDLPAGRYWLAARKRANGAKSGSVDSGDLNAVYQENPVVVSTGAYTSIGAFKLNPIDSANRQKRQDDGLFTNTSTGVTGIVIDEDMNPVAGVFVFAYRDSRMVGKPSYISAATRDDGRFQLYVEGTGDYYIGARSSYGGPLEPGEWVGTYDSTPEHRITIPEQTIIDIGEMKVHEVW